MNTRSSRPWAPGDPDAEYHALLKEQADQEGLSVAESTARARGLYGGIYEAAQSRAEKIGVTVQELYERDRALIEQSAYPTEACIRPFEVEAYLADMLAPERRTHVRACRACSALVEGAEPSAARQEEWTNMVREMAAIDDAPIDERHPESSTDIFATALLIGALAGLVAAITANPPVMVVASAIAFSGMASFLLVHGERLFATPIFRGVRIRSRSAAVPAAAGAALVLLVAVGVSQRIETADSTRELVGMRATSVAMQALSTWRETGEYPIVQENQGSIRISTDRSGDGVVYRVATPEGSQQVFADLRGDNGVLYRDAIGADMVEARIITGDISEVRPDGITIEDTLGASYELYAIAPQDIELAASVVAVTDASMEQLTSVMKFN